MENLRNAGDAHYLNYDFQKAQNSYQKALTYATKESFPTLWASLLINLGNANWEIATRTRGDAIRTRLEEALRAYRQAQEVYSRETFPESWAATQVGLGNALSDQGRRATGTESQRLLAEAVTAYRAALEVRTRQTLPQDWAATQMNLGNALSDQGTRATGPEKQRLLQEMVTAMGLSLEIFTREFFPSDWGMARSNIVEARFLLNEWKLVTQDVALLLPDPYITEASKVALQVLLILSLEGEGDRENVPTALENLRTRVTSQPPGFFMTWSFEAIKQFLHSQPQFASSRDWALKLIQAVERHGREHILEGLDSVITQHATSNQ